METTSAVLKTILPCPNLICISLHTTVMVGKNELLEAQIRTWEMHRTAEYGIYWRYKNKQDQQFEEKLDLADADYGTTGE